MINKNNNVVMTRSSSVEQTRALGARLARVAEAGDVYCLDGGLGSGKTEFVRGFAEELSPGEDVRSPTFSIVNIYTAKNPPIPTGGKTRPARLYHFDFYRIEDEREFREIGLDEYINGDGVCLIEWGSLFPNVLPDYTKQIRFRDDGGQARVIEADFLF